MAKVQNNWIKVDTDGFKYSIGDIPLWRNTVELITNVFDEYRGYDDSRTKPSNMLVQTNHYRGFLYLSVWDNGNGFDDIEDSYTLFSASKKRNVATVSGRFNVGEKQLLVLADSWMIQTKTIEDEKPTRVSFVDNVFNQTSKQSYNHKDVMSGTSVVAKIKCTPDQYKEIWDKISTIIPPKGLSCAMVHNSQFVKIEDGINAMTTSGTGIDEAINSGDASNYSFLNEREISCGIVHTVEVTLDTVQEKDGLMKPTQRKTWVEVRAVDSMLVSEDVPQLYELGIPVQELGNEFPYHLNVMQKVPLPQSRDVVKSTYLNKLIGRVLEQLALDGKTILEDQDMGATFLKGALDKIDNADALKVVVDDVVGEDAVSWTSNPNAIWLAEQDGKNVIKRNTFGADTMSKLKGVGSLQSPVDIYRDELTEISRKEVMGNKPQDVDVRCPNCNHKIM